MLSHMSTHHTKPHQTTQKTKKIEKKEAKQGVVIENSMSFHAIICVHTPHQTRPHHTLSLVKSSLALMELITYGAHGSLGSNMDFPKMRSQSSYPLSVNTTDWSFSDTCKTQKVNRQEKTHTQINHNLLNTLLALN